MEFAEAFCNEVNAFLHTAQSIALGSNYILFTRSVSTRPVLHPISIEWSPCGYAADEFKGKERMHASKGTVYVRSNFNHNESAYSSYDLDIFNGGLCSEPRVQGWFP